MVLGELHQVVRSSYKKATGAEPPAFSIEVARIKQFGDFSTNIAMVAAAELETSPMQLAQKIVAVLEQSPIFHSVSTTTPGFINFTVTDEHLLEVVRAIIKSPDSFGRSDLGKETRILLEYISANPTEHTCQSVCSSLPLGHLL